MATTIRAVSSITPLARRASTALSTRPGRMPTPRRSRLIRFFVCRPRSTRTSSSDAGGGALLAGMDTFLLLLCEGRGGEGFASAAGAGAGGASIMVVDAAGRVLVQVLVPAHLAQPIRARMACEISFGRLRLAPMHFE